MSQLLDITDNTDPQNVSVGNPGLKPSFTNNFRFFYNTFRQKYYQSLMTFVNFSTTRNGIGNSVYYNSVTGARTVKPGQCQRKLECQRRPDVQYKSRLSLWYGISTPSLPAATTAMPATYS